MDKINSDKLITFFSYGFIVFVLTSILYTMYLDFLYEKYFNIKKFNLKEKFTDSDIDEKLKYINLVEETRENYDISQPFILKKNISVNSPVLATCNINDQLSNTPSGSLCNIKQNNLYPINGGHFYVTVMADGFINNGNDCSLNISSTVYDLPKCIYNQTYQTNRQTQFIFPDNNKPRPFTLTNIVEQSIINYFNNYVKYNNYISNTKNIILSTSCSYNGTNYMCTPNDLTIINNYSTLLQNLLLLKNTPPSIFPMSYNSGYTYDINTVKTNLLNIYNNLLANDNSNINYTMYINDTTSIKFLTDADKNVYAMELHPSVVVTFTKLVLGFDLNGLSTSGITDNTSIWNLNYLNMITPDSSVTNVIKYTYKPDPIYFPIALQFVLPNSNVLSNNWNTSAPTGVINYINNIFKASNTNVASDLNLINTPTTSMSIPVQVTNNLQNYINILTNTNNVSLSSITDIFAIYDGNTNLFQIYLVTNGYSNVKNIMTPSGPDIINSGMATPSISYQIYTLIKFKPTYIPNVCTSGSFYNGLCLPQCPPEYPYDIGAACLSNNKNLYTRNSSLCNYLSSHAPSLSNPDPILMALMSSCQ
jgi:hypothetical protein